MRFCCVKEYWPPSAWMKCEKKHFTFTDINILPTTTVPNENLFTKTACFKYAWHINSIVCSGCILGVNEQKRIVWISVHHFQWFVKCVVLERARSRTSRIFYRTVHFHQVFGNVLILCNTCNILWSDAIAHYCLPAITRTIQHNIERLCSIPWWLGYLSHFQMKTGRVTCNVQGTTDYTNSITTTSNDNNNHTISSIGKIILGVHTSAFSEHIQTFNYPFISNESRREREYENKNKNKNNKWNFSCTRISNCQSSKIIEIETERKKITHNW